MGLRKCLELMISQRNFAVVEPSLWNSLLADVWRPEMMLHSFKWQLKSYLFHALYVDEQNDIHHPQAL